MIKNLDVDIPLTTSLFDTIEPVPVYTVGSLLIPKLLVLSASNDPPPGTARVPVTTRLAVVILSGMMVSFELASCINPRSGLKINGYLFAIHRYHFNYLYFFQI